MAPNVGDGVDLLLDGDGIRRREISVVLQFLEEHLEPAARERGPGVGFGQSRALLLESAPQGLESGPGPVDGLIEGFA